MGEYDDLIAAASAPVAAPTTPKATAAAPAGDDDYGDLIAAASGKAPTPEPSTWERVKSAAGKAAGAIGAMGTNALDAASVGAYSKARDLAYQGIDAASDKLTGSSPGLANSAAANDDQFNAEHRMLANTGRGLGYLLPMGAPSRLAEATGVAGKAGYEAMPSVVKDFFATHSMSASLAKNVALGAATNAGTTLAEDVTAGAPIKAALADAGDAAAGGAAAGGLLGSIADAARPGAIGEKLTAAARARVIKQGISDIVGTKETGRAIDTDVKKMARAIEPIRDELRTPEGLAIADTARTDPDAALQAVKQKLRDITKERLPDYKTIDAATGSVRAGDFVTHLEDSAKSMEATGRGKDAAVAAELRKAVGRLKGASDWGGGQRAPIDRNAPFDKNYTVGQYVDLMTKAGHGTTALADIEKMRPVGWNPDAIVPTVKLREIVTDMQSTAYDNLGGINGTNAFKKAQDVAHVGEEFLNQHLDAASKADPAAAEAADRIRQMNRRVNAYATIRNALDSRVGKVDTAEMKISPSTKLEMGGAAALAAAGSPIAAATGFAATKLLPKALGVADRTVSRAIANRGVGGVTVSPAAVARLIQAARAPGVTRQALQTQAEKDNVPPEIAANIAAQNGL